MDEKIKTCTLRFPAPQKTLIWRRHWSIGQSCRSMTSKRSTDWFLGRSWAWSFFIRAFAYQPKAMRVCIRSTNQSNRSIFVRLLFLSYSRVFISRSYENRSNSRSLQCPLQWELTVNSHPFPSPCSQFFHPFPKQRACSQAKGKTNPVPPKWSGKTLLQWKLRLHWDSNDDICNVWTVLIKTNCEELGNLSWARIIPDKALR